MKLETAVRKAVGHLPGPSARFFGGIAFTFIIAAISLQLAKLPLLVFVGPMLLCIMIAILYRQTLGYPESVRSGITFTSRHVLRFAIVLYGFRLNFQTVFKEGAGLLLLAACVIVFSIGITMLIARWIKADPTISFLLAAGTGVCGAAAIAAVAPIVKAKDEDTAVGVGMIAMLGTVFALLYAYFFHAFAIDPISYAYWTGLSLHEIAHVVAAAAPADETALAAALLAKLSRVVLLIPLCFALVYWIKRRERAETASSETGKVAFPWFLAGFIATSLLGTYVKFPDGVLSVLTIGSTFLLSSAMVGLGLGVNLRSIGAKAWKPAIALVITSVLLSVGVLFAI